VHENILFFLKLPASYLTKRHLLCVIQILQNALAVVTQSTAQVLKLWYTNTGNIQVVCKELNVCIMLGTLRTGSQLHTGGGNIKSKMCEKIVVVVIYIYV